MPRNIEFKARVDDADAMLRLIRSLADSPPETIDQDDTFFACSNGRLKLRRLADEHGVLIFYRRPDTAEPTPSSYSVTQTSDPDGLRSTLAHAHGVTGRVRKRRRIFRSNAPRIHFDEVQGLGTFIEIEVPIDEFSDVEAFLTDARHLMIALGIREESLVSCAYVDLLEANSDRGRDRHGT